jgi:hypothetical protein
VTHRERVGRRHLGDRDPRLRQIGLHAHPLDHRVEPGRLGQRDLTRADRVQGELVGQEQLRGREPGDDHEHHCGAHAGCQQDDHEQHVEQPEHRHREQHPQPKAEVPAEVYTGGGHAGHDRSAAGEPEWGSATNSDAAHPSWAVRRRLAAAVAVAIDFRTWQTLVRRHGPAKLRPWG